jgi:oligopeptide transport system ATP-binding protein
MSLLEVDDLSVSFKVEGGTLAAVRNVSFRIEQGETLALVGESGSGKSVTALSILQLLPYPKAWHPGGRIRLGGRDLLGADERTLREVRGGRVGIVFQEPMTSLNPLHTIARQIGEALTLHRGLRQSEARRQALELLHLVRLQDAEQRLDAYPHQLSGGQRQRVMIAMALANEPELLIADEPTTALDVTIQAQILDVIRTLQRETNTAMILITHDLGVVASSAHRIGVMYGGKIVETGTVREIFYNPQMPYTWGLLASIPLPTADRSLELIPIPGTPPSAIDPPKGCPFTARCPYAMRICADEMPEYSVFSEEHKAACWLHHPMAPEVEPPARVRGTR